MTCIEKICRANRWRITTGSLRSTAADGWNGHFLVPLEGELWHVIISDGAGWRHLSVTNAQKKVFPGWNIMRQLKEAFYADDEWAVIFLPAKDACVNDHPLCHHIWSPLNEEFPKPIIALV